MKRHFKSLTLAVVLLCSLALAAQASTVTAFSTTGFVIGSESITEGFTVPSDGLYKATITDYGFGSDFVALGFAIFETDPLSLVADPVDGAGGMGMFTFWAITSVNYVANIGALTGDAGIGLFSAEVNLVPIPGSLLLLGSGLLGLFMIGRRKR